MAWPPVVALPIVSQWKSYGNGRQMVWPPKRTNTASHGDTFIKDGRLAHCFPVEILWKWETSGMAAGGCLAICFLKEILW
jgi:hypothetical protein